MSTTPLEKIAIVGATGRIGGAFTKALLQAGKHTITALVREDSQGTLPEGVKAVKISYDDEASLVEALRDQQFLIISLGVRAPPDLHGKITAAAGKAGVPYILPNVFGFPAEQEEIGEDSAAYDKLVYERIADVKKNSVSSSVVLHCGFWYEWSLALGEQWFGITIKDRKVTFFDDGKRTITVSTWDQCGRAVAGLLSLPEAGPSPSLADFKNKSVPISSFRVSQRDMLDSLHRVLGTTDADWDIRYESTAKRVEDGAEELKNGDFRGFAKGLYGALFAPSRKFADYAATGTANDVLGLPKEDLDEATKRAVGMVESGWSPFA